jgi:hypothetical protein
MCSFQGFGVGGRIMGSWSCWYVYEYDEDDHEDDDQEDDDDQDGDEDVNEDEEESVYYGNYDLLDTGFRG